MFQFNFLLEASKICVGCSLLLVDHQKAMGKFLENVEANVNSQKSPLGEGSWKQQSSKSQGKKGLGPLKLGQIERKEPIKKHSLSDHDPLLNERHHYLNLENFLKGIHFGFWILLILLIGFWLFNLIFLPLNLQNKLK